MKVLSKGRTKLLLELEGIVGNECYNGNIQNWGPHGVFEGEGREFRYPVTFIDSQGKAAKRRYTDTTISPSVAITGYYAFGANQLHIVRALNRVLEHLEKNHDLKI